MTDDEVAIRRLRNSDSLQGLTDLLHRSYRVLAEMNLRYFATHQSVDQTRDRIGNGTCFVAVRDGVIVGTILYRRPGQSRGTPFYERPGVAKVSQLAVEPKLQQQGIATRLIDHAEKTARDDGALELALDTAEQATHLIEWYERLGYRFIEHADWDVTNYRSVVMSKRL